MIELKTPLYLQPIGELAEWSNAAVLKTVEGHTSGGSNPSFSAIQNLNILIINILGFFSTHICTIYVLLAHYVVSFKKIKVFLSATFPAP